MESNIKVVQHIGIETHYQLGLANGLAKNGVEVFQISNDAMAEYEQILNKNVHLINLRGDQNPDSPFLKKFVRVIKYYLRLLFFTLNIKVTLFHIQTDNKFFFFDRTFLLMFYKLAGKKLILTVHNVNSQARGGNSSFFNWLSLTFQYNFVDRLIVHTEKMKEQLQSDFYVQPNKISVIPIGINDQVPQTGLSKEKAREILDIPANKKVLLFFGNIDPYKGVDILLKAFYELRISDEQYFLIIAGKNKGNKDYFGKIEDYIAQKDLKNAMISKFIFIPDNEIEYYFKAADCAVLPYKNIFQSAVLVLAYSFGIPIIGTRVGNFENDIITGKTGFICEPNDSVSLMHAIKSFFEHDLYFNSEINREWIKQFAFNKYSWDAIGVATKQLYLQKDFSQPRTM